LANKFIHTGKEMNQHHSVKIRNRKILWGIWAILGGAGLLLGAAPLTSAYQEPVEVRQVGISRVGEHTLLTVILTKPAAPLISQKETAGVPQMILDFPQARPGKLPTQQFGDDLLVKRVVTQVSPSGRGVQIVLEMAPNRPYTWWRQSRPLKGGQTAFILGFKAEGPPSPAQMLPSPPSEPSLEIEERQPEPAPEPPWKPGPVGPGPRGGFAELQHLVPQAAPLWQFLEREGWTVAEAKDYDHPGKRFSRAFTLINPRYPEAVVNVAHLPANTPGTPNINVIDLAFERLHTDTARKYRELQKMNFAQIKRDYEDIGDFFDDALKPLRVKLRKECQDLALRWSAMVQEFLRHAAPQEPRAAEEVLNRIKAKVNPRFEGVQYTISERPLLFLNLVDFLYIRCYYLGNSLGGEHA
jgi:hypothetical protein